MTRSLPSRRARSGFTLTEVLIALFILTFGLVGIWFLFPVGIDAAGRSLGTVVATNFAKAVTAKANALNSYASLPQTTADLADANLAKFESLPSTDAHLAPFRLYTGYKYGLYYSSKLYTKAPFNVNGAQRGSTLFLRVNKGRFNWYFLITVSDLTAAMY